MRIEGAEKAVRDDHRMKTIFVAAAAYSPAFAEMILTVTCVTVLVLKVTFNGCL
jgi:hypothetical protein